MLHFFPATSTIPNHSPVSGSHAERRWGYVALIGLVTAALHLAVAGRYDFFRNELYFIVCGRHPAFGYVDQPPLVPLLAAATQLMGHHVWLLRLPGVAAAVALVPLCAAFAGLFSATRLCRILAASAAAFSPALAGLTATLTTSTFEPLCWTLAAYFLLRGIREDNPRPFMWAALVVGLSMQAKYGIAIWLIGLLVGLIATPERRCLTSRGMLLGATIAVVTAVPSLIWQGIHGWPFLAVMQHHHETGSNLTGSPLQYELRQAIDMNLLLAPLWIAGVMGPFITSRLRDARFLSIAFIVTTALTIAAGGKNYYLFAVYPCFFALGAAAVSSLRPWLVILWLVLIGASFVILAPLTLPLLAPPQLAHYMDRTHIRPRPMEIAGIDAPLTQVFSDEMGWEDLEQKVAEVYHDLPASEQANTVILAFNYGDAAAIDFYGDRDQLPPVISGANQYYLWGPRGADGTTTVLVNAPLARWSDRCREVQVAAQFGALYAMPYEHDRPILLCRGLRFDLARAWPRFQRYQ